MSPRSGTSSKRHASRTETLSFGAVHLDVSDGGRALGFWHDLVGLAMLESPAGELRLGAGEDVLVVLHPGAERGVVRGHSGLYHLAIHLPEETEFARVLWRLIVAGHPHAPTDHTMSKSIYLTDPDGIGLELTLETPERLREARSEAEGPAMIDSEGQAHPIAEPLDVNEVLAHLPNRDFDQPLLPPKTKIGHIHLHVSDLEESLRFYRDLIGFDEHMNTPEFGFADLSAGGAFPHRLALNVWEGRGAPQPPEGSAKLRYYTVVLRSEDDLIALRRRLAETGHEPEPSGEVELVHDPAGNAILLAAESQ